MTTRVKDSMTLTALRSLNCNRKVTYNCSHRDPITIGNTTVPSYVSYRAARTTDTSTTHNSTVDRQYQDGSLPNSTVTDSFP